MSHRITADHTTLMRQAPIKSIDDRFGDGYTQANPELIGAFMQAAAQDFDTAITAQTIQDAADQISESLRAQSD